MANPDIPAIELLDKELRNIRTINDPPKDYKDARQYRKNTEVVIDNATDTAKNVYSYAKNIDDKLSDIRQALAETTVVVQKEIKRVLENISRDSRGNVGEYVHFQSTEHSGAFSYVQDLLSLEVKKTRLDEAVLQSKEIVAKIEKNMGISLDDFEKLKGCIKSWEMAKKESHEDEKRRLEEERRRREEAEKRRKEDQERRRKEEEEKRKREEEERKKREEEERKKREEEERLRKENEKRLREEEEERKRQEEEARKIREEEEERLRKENEKRLREEAERMKQEEEARKIREEEERKRREAEERRRLEQEEEERRRQKELERLEAQRREKERLRREAEERRRRLDPNNWKPIIYSRAYDEKDDSRSHHQGISCAVTAVPGSIQEDDIQCLASDEDEEILPTLSDGEKLLSSVVTLESCKGRINLEAPMRAYIPHHPVHDASDELVVKVSVNGSDWAMTTLITPPPGSVTDKNLRIVGVELQDYETAKIVVVARPRSQSLIIDKPGTSQYSQSNKNVKIFVPRDAFEKPTECKLSVKSIPEKVLSDFERGSDFLGTVISTGPVINFACQTPPSKTIEFDILRSSDSDGSIRLTKGKNYQLYKTNKNVWQIADVEYKGKGKDVSITLPALKYLYSILDIEVPQSTPREEVIKLAKHIYDTMNKTVVRMIVKQKQENPEHAIFHCVGRDLIPQRIDELVTMGYTAGPDTSREMYLFDGQKVCVTLSGNIESAVEGSGQVVLPFYAYMDTAKQSLILRVKDIYKQKDMHEYAGNVHCQILPLGVSSSNLEDVQIDQQLDMPISLPKTERLHLHRNVTRIHFPYYLSALAEFVAWKLTEDDHGVLETEIDWFAVLCLLDSEKKMNTLRNRAKPKSQNATSQELCKIILLDWMKATNVCDDKVRPILSAIRKSGLRDLERECNEFVKFQKKTMTDSVLHDVADMNNDHPRTFGSKLGMKEDVISTCMNENQDSATDQKFALLMEWRISITAIEKGTRAFEYLHSLIASE